ncbi:hypothetical protein L5515_009463 [Caenorhabditis briggsae]|uniref:Uncharacterized protein n=1 Tax=Caenorhabditis briggsae TaxID=6238 RepID=A0AAE9F8T7_CAEBR|nr:hypothetical protein L5515_009463 [Caenorhabditis briggsae]
MIRWAPVLSLILLAQANGQEESKNENTTLRPNCEVWQHHSPRSPQVMHGIYSFLERINCVVHIRADPDENIWAIVIVGVVLLVFALGSACVSCVYLCVDKRRRNRQRGEGPPMVDDVPMKPLNPIREQPEEEIHELE